MNHKEIHTEIKKAYSHLHSYAYYLTRSKIDAEDLTQDTILKILDNYEKFNRSRTDLKKWGISVMHNLFMDKIKSFKTQKRSAILIPIDEIKRINASDFQDPCDKVVIRSFCRELKRYLGTRKSLEPKKVLFILICMGLSYAEIADFLDIPIGSVKWEIHNLKKIKS